MVTGAVVSRVAGNRCAGAHWTVGSGQAMAAVAAAVGRTVVLGAARAVEAILREMDLVNSDPNHVHYRYFVTDAPESFAQTGAQFLGRDLDSVDWIDY